jgi:hypothetical protein
MDADSIRHFIAVDRALPIKSRLPSKSGPCP